jgi:5'-nucleotidase
MSQHPRILVTNDDGHSAAGIIALIEALEGVGEVWMVAPEGEQSAVSHALTLDRPLRVRRIAPRRFVVNGTPTDCVTLGISRLMHEAPPAVVVSGINRGANMGVDVHYSGTVSAAFEGVILGTPAIAMSQIVGNGIDWTAAATVARELTSWVLAHGLPESTLLNVNVPPGRPRGLRLTRLGVRRYTEGVLEQTDPRGRTIYWIGGGEPVWEPIPGTDFNEVGGGWISVTPLGLDMTAEPFLGALEASAPSWVRSYDGA